MNTIFASALADRKKGAALWLLIAAALLLFFTFLSAFWVGFQGSDDATYWEGSTGWLRHFPYLAHSHWALRHTLVVPMAAARLVFGDTSPSLFLPPILYATGVIVVVGVWTWRSAGAAAAIGALLFIISTPQMVIYSSTAAIDIIELFFVLCAFSTLDSVMSSHNDATSVNTSIGGSNRGKLLLAGGFLGFGLLSRETAAFAIVAVALLGLAKYQLERKYYLFVAAGLAAVIGLEFLYLWIQSGQLFYRYSVDVHHDSNINRWVDQGAAIPFLHPAVDPFTMLLLNHNFGLAFWIAAPLAIWLSRRHDLQARERMMVVLLGTLALVWTAIAAMLWIKLTLIPRYYLVPTVCVLILAGLALARMWQEGRRWMPIALCAILVSSNLVALSLDNRNLLFGEYKLVELLARHKDAVHTDSQTARRVQLLLDWAGIRRERVTAAAAREGDLVFINPLRPHSGQAPAQDWKVLYEVPIPLSGGHLLACSLPEQFVPAAMLGNLRCGHEFLRLYRVGTVRSDHP